MFSDYPDLLSVNDIQAALKIGRNNAYKLIKEGTLTHVKIGRKIKIPKRFLIDFILGSCYNNRIATANQSCYNMEVSS